MASCPVPRAPCVAARQLPERVPLQRVGIAEVDPAHGALQHHGAKLAGQRMSDAQWIAPIDQVVLKRGDHAAVVEGSRSSTRTEPLHEGVQVVRVSPMESGPLESCSARNILILQKKSLAIFFFQVCLMNKAGLRLTNSGTWL